MIFVYLAAWILGLIPVSHVIGVASSGWPLFKNDPPLLRGKLGGSVFAISLLVCIVGFFGFLYELVKYLP